MGQKPPRVPDAGEPAEEPRPNANADAPVGPAPRVFGKERMKAGIRAALFGDLDTEGPNGEPIDEPDDVPDRLGRFRILGELGRGGMGEVYSAYDPELDRKVAIKLLRRDLGGGSSGSQGPSRLQREAQAMARVNHPNVATVHEVGTLGERLYVAMEYIDGGTLRQWLAERDRTWSEILGVYLQAGEGLAAAHDAGLVHRDFKPDNVLLGADGRVRVVDFGLARSATLAPEVPRPDASLVAHRDGRDPLATPLTQTGAVMGTPAYMASEQHGGEPADARSDQFSFCVALWEALMGQRPFAGRTYAELMVNVVRGRRREPVANRGVPTRVIAALERGLQVDPSARFEDMHGLLEALRPRSRRRVAIVAGVGALALAVAGTWAAARKSAADACDDVRHELDGVWDAQRRDAARAAMLATERPFAQDVSESALGLLDEYAQRWTAAAAEVCAAELVADDTDLYQRRRRCLEARRAELGELVELFEEGEPSEVLEAVQAVLSLSPVRECSDERRLAAWSVPRDPQARQELAELRADLGVAKVRGLMGRYEEAATIARKGAERGEYLDDPATEAWAHLLHGQYLERSGDVAGAEEILRRAVARAEVADAHAIRVEALIHLVYVVGRSKERWDEARTLANEAAAVIRVIGPDPALEGKLDISLGGAARRADLHEEARDYYAAALAIFEKHFGEAHLGTARSHSNLGVVLGRLGELDAADRHLRQALQSFERLQGPDHPAVAIVLATLGNNLGYQNRPEEAIEPLRRSLAIRRKNHGDEHPTVVTGYYNLGWGLYSARHYEESIEALRRGLEIQEGMPGPHPRPPSAWKQILGGAALHAGDHEGALRHLDGVLSSATDDTPTRVWVLAAAAAAHTDWDRARALVAAGLEHAKVETEAGQDRADDVAALRGLIEIGNSLDQLEALAHSTTQ